MNQLLSKLWTHGHTETDGTSKSGRYSLLLVEDDITQAKKVQEALSDSTVAEVNLCHVDSAGAAVDQLMARQFDIILLDSSLPDSPRLECFDQIHQLAADAPIVLLAERQDENIAARAVATGADRCLFKDHLDHRTVTHAVHQSLDHPKQANGHVGSRAMASELAPTKRDSHLHLTHDQLCPQLSRELSHAFRVPLTGISEYCSIVRDGLAGAINAEQCRYLELAVELVDDLNTTVNCVLDLDCLETETPNRWREASSLYRIMDELLPALKRKAASRNLAIQVDVSSDLPELYCDPELVGRAIMTLAFGALGSAVESNTLEITAQVRRVDSEVAIKICLVNHGTATPSSDTPPNTPLPVSKLWLSSVAKIVRLNLGELHVSESVDGLASYEFAIPFADPETVVGRYIQIRRKEIESPCWISLVIIDFPGDLPTHQANAIDELLHKVVRKDDLLFRLDSKRWLLIAEVEQGREDSPLDDIRDAWAAANQNRTEPLPIVSSALKAFYHILPAVTHEVTEQPVTNAMAEGAPTEESTPPIRSAANRRILLVDDERTLIQALSLRLNLLGFEVITAGDGCEGLKLATEQSPALIVLDIRMPKMDGLTMLDQLHQHGDTANIPVVIVSASHVDRRQALQRGARYFLEKPYDSQVLVATIAAALGDPAHSGVA
jgi:CheY-like chemotaxis protein